MQFLIHKKRNKSKNTPYKKQGVFFYALNIKIRNTGKIVLI